ncbi:hypothetical protein ABZ568_10545 [Streptomyces olindensis]|uniref:Secreted protein n=1 Tax=Streptomyces olindensis TaxID=358823 RepID=A0ABV2XSU2_9ACTN
MAAVGPAHANKGFGGADGETQEANSGEDDTVSVTMGVVVFDRSENGSGNSAELQKSLEPTWEAGSTGYEWDAKQRDRYVNGHPYKEFNKDKTGKGYFWDSFVNEDFPPGWDSCDDPPSGWISAPPPPANVENAVTPEIFEDAVTYPASGVCETNDGRIGEPYAKGKANRTPPCGVRYLRSSGDGTYPLQATVTWKIEWTGTGGTGGELPDGEFGATQDVVVQEIQAVNR